MGKRKQKVQWSKVDGFDWSQDEQNGPLMEVMKGETGPGASSRTRRSSAPGWTSSLAPRFERRAAAEADQKHIYYEGELCEAEELPNGFTKIRSKNLDILFKRDYYEQRLAAQRLISEGLTKLQNSETEVDSCHKILDEDNEDVIDTVPTIESMESFVQLDAEFTSQTFDNIDLNEIPEFKPMNIDIKTTSCDIDSGHTSPFYGNYPPYHPQEDTEGNQYGAPPRPNLYLYSPSNNTLIPCDEIIIPNPVMSPEGPVYSGPTNIYLAYPVQGQDGRGYITQPFLPPGSAGSYMSQDSCSYSPSISYDGSTHYSSTPHTPNSGEDSGSSTQTTSPPALDIYHPSNWIKQDHLSQDPKDVFLTPPVPKHTEEHYDQQPVDKSVHLSHPKSTQNAAPPQLPDAPKTTVTYIPGLTQDSIKSSSKKSQKRRKKKTKTDIIMEKQSSNTSSESEIHKFCISGQSDNVEQSFDSFVPEKDLEIFQEIHLTDDLADSLVNPPTDPEGSDDECLPKKFANLTNLSSDIRNLETDINTMNVSSEAVNNTDIEVDNVFNQIEDNKECEINDKLMDSTNANNSVAKAVTLQTTIDNSDTEIIKNILADSGNTESNPKEKIDNKEVNVTDAKSFAEPDEKEGEICLFVTKQIENLQPALENEIGADKSYKKRIRKKKEKKEQQVVPNSILDRKVDVPILSDEIAIDNDCPTSVKKSYSSVIKSRLVTAPNNLDPISNPLEVSGVPISSPPKVPALSISSPIEPTLLCPAATTRSEQKSDNDWQNVPLSGSTLDSWKKTSKKRKHKRMNITFQDSPLPQELPDLEVVEQQEESKTPVEIEKPVQKDDFLQEEILVLEENTNSEQEKNKLRRRKKKNVSEDPDESKGGHRVVICDEQISLNYHQEAIGSPSPLFPSLVDKVRTSVYSDFLVVSELGCGISRGCMNLGRLYQGKYVAPERTDGLIHQPDEEESVEEDESNEQVINQIESLIDSTDLDLD